MSDNGELLHRVGRYGKTESVDGHAPPLSTEQQRARIRIAALVLEAQLVARIRGGERKTPNLAEQVQSVQEVLGRVGREPGRDDGITIKEHHARLAAALAAVEGSDESEGLTA